MNENNEEKKPFCEEVRSNVTSTFPVEVKYETSEPRPLTDEIIPRHQSLNNFRPFMRGFPFAGNTIAQALMIEDIQDDKLISVGIEQIDALLTPSPFEPDLYGFKMDRKDKTQKTYISKRDNDTVIILKKIHDNNTGMWSLMSRSIDGNRVYFPEFKIFLPNDLAARIVLISLGIMPRADLGDDGQGCIHDDDKDGICPNCEMLGYCMNEIKKGVEDGKENS